ncbi:MAG: AAA family ATPase [Candidatus Micrarchaeota archaeon]|nr:AAA family ATPase [Candidatus Micrarchaeota archaeon]
MLTKLIVKNFKRFDEIEVELGEFVVFIGPNNSGKTSALQALALWDIGLRRWIEKRENELPKKRPGVTINRKDLIATPVPEVKLLWRDLHVRSREEKVTQNIRIDIIVQGVIKNNAWECGLEFDYANEESLYCRPLRKEEKRNPARMEIPVSLKDMKVSFLPPMSGLSDREFLKDQGEIGFLIGQGLTAQVLRNLCWKLFNIEKNHGWEKLTSHIEKLFGIKLLEPILITERSEIKMSYEDRNKVKLDISCSGRGLQQTLLLLAQLYSNPNTVLLLDEPDAHLEILRQREIYQLLSDVAKECGSQIIAASHSEVILNEAAERDVVIAFVGNPHRINDRVSNVLKALKDIRFDDYYQAEQTGWILYLEGPTDLAILREFAKRLKHEALSYLQRPFVHYLNNNLLSDARKHFYGLKEAKSNLQGIVIVDRVNETLESNNNLIEVMWKKREIENYLCTRQTLLNFAKDYSFNKTDMFTEYEKEQKLKAMENAIDEVSKALKILSKPNPWSPDCKVSDDFLKPLFDSYYNYLKLPNVMNKTYYHKLVPFVPDNELDIEINEKLDLIVEVAQRIKKQAK